MLGPFAAAAEGPSCFWGPVMSTGDRGGAFATLTHARLRATQGDVAGAMRILRVILAAQPAHVEAREFLDGLEGRVAITYREPPEVQVEAVRPAKPADLKERFRDALGGSRPPTRAARLAHWLERVQRNRGEHRVR